ncbi:hypothetical protein F5B22DRAFT_16401 [Xylaria bambusicola]|uniref:uncharacterized protein n=1 Tax=Xylaria bambusicola TaxID=326684 RepID=UPI0020079FB5|nr:uncharacterized protein F5B22DRAFT_16401 [Xylaria bambusicola]KAI0528026.1 hypothetical protein F5B22DRAFT_16401 [Xylaria bambusicola]
MTTVPSSPKRRHILSSINPEKRPISPEIEESHQLHGAPQREPRDSNEEQSADTTLEGTARKTTKFRFKSKRSRSHRSSRHDDPDRDRARSPDAECEDNQDGDPTSSRRHRKHRHHRHHRHKRRRTRSRSPTPPNPHEPPPLNAEAAFRESLFDAMADDEGAAYWEGVYGQPIHTYSQERPGPEGELERMDDDEYAAYVRQRMWEKTHQGLLEERARREERRKQKERNAKETARLTREMEASLRRGEERRAKRVWKERWDTYIKAWDAWDGTLEGMAWPVQSGRREVIDGGAVREFLVMGIDPVEVGEVEFLAKLKDERVRWHPDKIQQRLGGRVDEAVLRDVTAVFQIVDKLWTDTRSKQKARAQ